MSDISAIYNWLQETELRAQCARHFGTDNEFSIISNIIQLGDVSKDELISIVSATIDDTLYDILTSMAKAIANSRYVEYFSLKGGLVLMTLIRDAGLKKFLRKTSDMDIHCSARDKWDSFCNDCENIFNNNSEGYTFTLIKRRNDLKPSETSDSLQFKVSHSSKGVISVSIDMNVKPNDTVDLVFNSTLGLNVYSVVTMLSDKINVVTDYKLHRRIKDLYDLYTIVETHDIAYDDLQRIFHIKHGKSLTDLCSVISPSTMESLSHAYSKYDGIVNKPTFERLVEVCNKFTCPIFSGALSNGYIWYHEEEIWIAS